MSSTKLVRTLMGVTLILTGVVAQAPLRDEGPNRPVRFNRDIRPILSDNCYACHGPDQGQREADLRLDQKAGLLDDARTPRIIVPGAPDRSELVRRIAATSSREHMPPTHSGKSLTRREVALIRQWIAEGADWQGHWAYETLVRPTPPTPSTGADLDPIDRFVSARLAVEGLTPSPPADRVTLIRRLSYDLLGLPPSVDEVDAFVDDTRPEAYDDLVDRLLASPHYGERMGIFWLDLVRFADTRGIHSDNGRNVTPYRDWVIDRFNANMPFDEFTIQQLAGDLLPDATRSQRVATCYNKLNLTTEEGGSQPKEFEIRAYADRVRNMSSVWLGSTLECAECHDHKFDPFTAEDFYRTATFFADIQERAITDRDQGIPIPTEDQKARVSALERDIKRLQTTLDTSSPQLAAAQREWEKTAAISPRPDLKPWHSIGPFTAGDAKAAFKTAFAPESGIDYGSKYQDGRLEWRVRSDWVDGKVHTWNGANAATYLHRKIEVEAARTIDLALGSDDGIKVWVNGTPVLAKEVYRAAAANQEKITVPLQSGHNSLLIKISNGGGPSGFYFRMDGSKLYEDIQPILRMARGARTAEQQVRVDRWYRSIAPVLDPVRKRLAKTTMERDALVKSSPRCLVTKSGTPREVRLRPRGNWMDDSGPVMQPGVPAFLGGLETNGARPTRLDLARWLVSRKNPLTARALVNRLWRLFFGEGLSRNVDDIGAQGEWPDHPELLDWLAVELMESGWNIKHIVGTIVRCRTYRQTSTEPTALREFDPGNRLLARQARFRLGAELVRDNALAISGLLVRDIGGPSVKPYQPAGYWRHLNFPKRKWKHDQGDSAYRRGLYTWWQRTFVHPAMRAFDAPSRERCIARRERSNIPQQALVALNDPTFVEAARVFAASLMKAGQDDDATLQRAWRRALSRRPEPREVAVLQKLLARHRKQYGADPKAAAKLLTTGLAPIPDGVDVPELAAWTSVTRTLLCLRETITRY